MSRQKLTWTLFGPVYRRRNRTRAANSFAPRVFVSRTSAIHSNRSKCPRAARLARWEERWVAEAADLITDAYRGHVDSAISDQYRSRAGALRFLDNIIHYPGCGEFDPECSFLAFDKHASQPCGIVLSSVVGDRVSHITQVCVGPESQGAGIGRALICHIIRKLQDRNFAAVTLTVTNSNEAVRLYEKLGFTTIKEFHAFAWDAPD